MNFFSYFCFRFHEIIDDVLSEDEALPPRYKSRSDQHRIRINQLSKPKGTYTVVDAQKLLKKERETNKKKMDVSHARLA